MKKFLQLSTLGVILFLISCDSEEPTVAAPNEIGKWELDGFQFKNVADGFDSINQDRQFTIQQWISNTLEKSFLELNVDNTFKNISVIQGIDPPPVEGTWKLEKGEDDKEDDLLTLTVISNGQSQNIVYDIVENKDDNLHLSQEIRIALVPDVVYDTFPGGIQALLTMPDSVIRTFTAPTTFDLLTVYKRSSSDN